MKTDIPLIISTPRSGSTFLANSFDLDFKVNYYEWLSPFSYNECRKKGDADDKNEYLDYCAKITSGQSPGFGMKLTPHLFDPIWSDYRLSYQSSCISKSLKVNPIAIFTLRYDVFGAAYSIWKALKGMRPWHTGFSHSPLVYEEQMHYTYYEVLLNYIEEEISLISYCFKSREDIKILFYEDLISTQHEFLAKAYGFCDKPVDIQHIIQSNPSKRLESTLDGRSDVNQMLGDLSESENEFVFEALRNRAHIYRTHRILSGEPSWLNMTTEAIPALKTFTLAL